MGLSVATMGGKWVKTLLLMVPRQIVPKLMGVAVATLVGGEAEDKGFSLGQVLIDWSLSEFSNLSPVLVFTRKF